MTAQASCLDPAAHRVQVDVDVVALIRALFASTVSLQNDDDDDIAAAAVLAHHHEGTVSNSKQSDESSSPT